MRRSFAPGWWATFALAIGLLVAWRCVNLGADPRTSFIPSDIGYHIDEGYKTLNAKNVILFGQPHWNAQDRYPPRLERSPFMDGFYTFGFRAFGVDRLSARFVTVGFAAAFLILVAGFMTARYPPSIALAGVVLLGTDQGLFHFSRVGLVEMALCFFVYAGILGAAHLLPERRSTALFVLCIAATMAFAVKASVLIYLAPPLVALGALEMFRRGDRGSGQAGIRPWVAMTVVGLVTGWLLWMAWRDGAGRFDPGALLQEPERLVFHPLYQVSPFAVGLAWLALLDIYLRNGLRSILENRYLVLIAATVLGPPIILALIGHNPPRYYLPVVPAALLTSIEWLHLRRNGSLGAAYALTPSRTAVAAVAIFPVAAAAMGFAGTYLLGLAPFIPQGVDPGLSLPTLIDLYPLALVAVSAIVLMTARHRLLSNVVVLGLGAGLIGHTAVSIHTNLETVLQPTYATAAVEDRLREILPAGASVGGDWAPYFTLGTGIPSLYMTRHLNTGNNIQELRPTHFLHSQTPWDSLNARRISDQSGVRLDDPVHLGNVFTRNIELHRIDYEVATPDGMAGATSYRTAREEP